MAARRGYHSSEEGSAKYSDDFLSDNDRSPTPRNSKDLYINKVRGRGRGSGAMRSRGRGRPGFRRGRHNSRNSEPADMRTSYDSVTKRVLSASRNRVNDLRNKVEELKIQIRELEQENKLFKKLQFRQEKAIRHFENKENDLPSIMEKHNNEVRALKEQNRRLRDKYDKSDRYLRDAEDELERVKKKMKKYKDMVEEKDLEEREDLSRKLTKAEIDMEEKDVKIKDLQRQIELLKKNHSHQLGIEVARQKDLKRQLSEQEDKRTKVEAQLKDKEHALEKANIYSRPAQSTSDENLGKYRLKVKAPSLTDLTPRDKAKFYEEKRREEVLKQKKLTNYAHNRKKAEIEEKKRKKWEAEERERKEKEKMDARSRESSPTSPRELQASPRFNFASLDSEAEKLKLEQQRIQRELDESDQRVKEEMERKKQELLRRQEEEKKEQEKRNRKIKDEERKRELEKQERERELEELERRRKEEEEKRREEEERMKEEEERERREKERIEEERRLQQEREKLDNDPMLREERRRKDELLRKLNAMDELGSSSVTSASKAKPPPDPFAPSPPTKRRMGSGAESVSSSFSKRSEPKEYSFTQPVNNLHQGKPSHERVLGRHKQSSEDADGYLPSFGSASNKNKPLSLFNDEPKPNPKSPEKKSNLLENLFGPASNKTNTKENQESYTIDKNDNIFMTQNSPPLNKTTVFPWDESSGKSANQFEDGKTSAFGNVSLFDDDLSGNVRVLPRRGRNQNMSTFSAKPTVNVVDSLDDDLEEVVL